MNIDDLTEDDLRNMSEEELDQLDWMLSQQDAPTSATPSPERKDSQLQLFRDIIQTGDTKKLGNLSAKELGDLPHTVRTMLSVALYLESEGLIKEATYFRKKAEITFATSLSQKGTLLQAIITQIKKEIRGTTSIIQPKKKLFSGWGKSPEQQAQQQIGGIVE